MTEKQINTLKKKYADYVKRFSSEDDSVQANLNIKIEHTKRVCTAARQIGQSLDLNPSDMNLAEVCALLHDVGRYAQYTQYHTFVDDKSVNHAELGAEILTQENMLRDVETREQNIILKSVRYHNRLHLPKAEENTVLFFTKLLRDADKIDIYKVVTDYYKTAETEVNEAIQLELPDIPEISPAVFEDIRQKRLVKKEHLRTLNDFKLLKMAWVYGFNFPETCRIVRERGYMHVLRQSMPVSNELDEVFQMLLFDLDARCRHHEMIPVQHE